MQQDVSNAKQLIVERVRQSTNILVAVSANPSVDALAAALGLAIMLNKMDKHATAVFSGQMPPAMEFLEPGKTFEQTVDSLRDFIISLDKEKADRLRYKVENDVVRIFITPYRTTLTQKDLEFSQGDFNVETIIALGVDKREDLDKAIVAHGRILHDATVITVNANNQQSTLGAVDWHEPNASSLCEMLVSLSESFQQPGLLDAQIATALLTGIVAATDRFSNEKTSPRIMTMAAQLMAAGANQQLIANNLVKAHELPEVPGGGQLVPNGQSIKVEEPPKPKKDGELDIEHSKEEPKKQAAPAPKQPKGKKPKDTKQSAEDELASALPSAAAASAAFDELKNAIETDTPAMPTQPPEAPGSQSVNEGGEENTKEDSYIASSGSWRGRRLEPPALGGTLNATAEQALSDARKAEDEERNQKLLSHDEVETATPAAPAPRPSADSAQQPTEPAVTPELVTPVEPAPAPEPTQATQPQSEPAQPPIPPVPQPTPAAEPVSPETPAPQAPTDESGDLDAARQAVNEALTTQPFNPAGQPLQSAGAMPFGVEDTQQAPPATPTPAPDVATQPAPTFEPLPPPPAPPVPQGDTALPPLPPMPPLPQQDASQPLPPPPSMPDLPPPPADTPPAPLTPPPAPPAEQGPADPGQFKIPSA